MASSVKNVTVFYSHSASNIGDIAINRGSQALIDRAFPDCQINFVSLPTSNPKFHDDMRGSFMPAHNLRHTEFSKSSDRIFDYVSDTDAFLDACGARDADLVLVNSGEHLFSYDNGENADSLFWRTLPVYAAKRAGKSAAILPSTFGPFRSSHSQNLVRSILGLADGAPAREPHSLRLQSELLGRNVNPVLPDPAFFITPQSASAEAKAAPVTLGISMRLETWGIRLDASGRASQKALARSGKSSLAEVFSVRLCSSFLAQAGRKAVLFVQTDADADLAVAILEGLSPEQQAQVRIERPLTIDDYCERLGGIDYLVTSRFHAIILGTLVRRPSTGVYFESHGHKIPGLVEMYPELGQAFNVTVLDADRAAQMVLEEIETTKGFGGGLDAGLEQSREEAVAWLRGCGNRPADPDLLLQAATSLAFYGNQVREAALRKEASAAVKTVLDLKKKEQDALVARLSGSATKLEKATEDLASKDNRVVEKIESALMSNAAKKELETEKKQLAAASAKLESELKRLAERHEQQSQSLAVSEAEKTRLAERQSELSAQLDETNDRLRAASQSLAVSEAKKTRLAERQSELSAQLDETNDRLRAASQSLAVSEAERARLAERQSELSAQLDETNDRLRAASQSLAVSEKLVEVKTMEAEAAARRCEELASRELRLVRSLDTARGSSRQKTRELSQIRQELQDEISRATDRATERDTALSALAGAREQVADLEQKRDELETSFRQALADLDRLQQELSGKAARVRELESNIDQLVDVSRVALKQAAGTVQTGLHYKVGQEVIRALKRPYRFAILPVNLWRIRSNITRKAKAGKVQTLAELDNRLLLEAARSQPLFDTAAEIGKASNRQLLRAAFWSAYKAKDEDKSTRILARLEQLQKDSFVETEEKFLVKFRNKVKKHGSTYPIKKSSKYDNSHTQERAETQPFNSSYSDESNVIDPVKYNKEEAEFFDSVKESWPPELETLDYPNAGSKRRILPRKNSFCYFLDDSPPDSSTEYATRAHGLAKLLAAQGFRVTIVTRPGFPVDAKPELDAASVATDEVIDKVTYRRLMEPNRTGVRIADYLAQSADAMEKLLRELRPEVVMAASNFHTGLPALIAARRLGIPFIYEVRGFWEVTRASRDPSFVTQTSYALQSFMEAELCRRADAVLTLTRGMKAELVGRGVPAELITLAPNACDPAQFLPRDRSAELADRLGIPAGVPVIGYIGSFVQYEGLDDLASACALLKKRGVEFRLMIVGNENVSGGELGPIAASIREIAENGGFTDWLIMPDRVPHEEVPEYYSLIDVAPFPRKPQPVTEMVSPMKPLEAMAMKKAVLVSSVDALAEMVRDGETGVIFEKGNIEDLAKRIADLIADPEQRSNLGETGRHWVEKERTWNASAAIVGKAFDALKFVRVENDLGAIEDLIPPKNTLAYTPDGDRVLYVLHNSMPYASGGYATRGHGLAKGLLNNGFPISCFTRPGFPVDTSRKFRDIEIKAELDLDGVIYRNDQSFRRGSMSDVDYIKQAADVYEAEILKLRPAYVQAASFATWTGIPALIAARRTGTPFAYEVRGLAEITNMSRKDNYAATPEYKWLASLEAIACKHADHVFTLTGAMKDELVSRDVDPSTVTLLPNSCDVDNFHPAERDASLAAELGIQEDDMVIGYIGTFVDYEGLDDLATACVHLKQRGVKFKLLLVGSENVQNSAAGPIASLIRRIVAEGGIEDHVIMPGRVPHDLVHRYYSLIDIAAFPRKPLPVTELVSPMKPLEAMAMEKAVLVSGVGALAEMVQDGETGVVFEKGNTVDLADKLEWLSGDIEFRRRIGRNSREWVRDNRTWKATAGILAAQIRAMI